MCVRAHAKASATAVRVWPWPCSGSAVVVQSQQGSKARNVEHLEMKQGQENSE